MVLKDPNLKIKLDCLEDTNTTNCLQNFILINPENLASNTNVKHNQDVLNLNRQETKQPHVTLEKTKPEALDLFFNSLSDEEAKLFAQIINRFILTIYQSNQSNVTEHLQLEIKKNFPELTNSECALFAHELLISLNHYQNSDSTKSEQETEQGSSIQVKTNTKSEDKVEKRQPSQSKKEAPEAKSTALPPSPRQSIFVTKHEEQSGQSFLKSKLNALKEATSDLKILNDQQADKIKKQLIKQGAEEATKAALGAAIKMALTKGVLKNIGSHVSSNSINNIASLSVESAKIVHKVATKQMTKAEATKEFTDCAASTLAGSVGQIHGGLIGASMGAIAGPIGIAVGGVIGGTVGSYIYSEGAKVGTKIVYDNVPKVVDKAVDSVKSVGSKLNSKPKTADKPA